MAKNDPEQVVAGAGLLTSIFTKLNTAVIRKGGQLGVLHRLSTPDGDTLIEQFAEIIVGQPDTFTSDVNYDDPQWQTIADYPITEHGTKLVQFHLLEFDHDPTGQEVLGRIEHENLRQPDRAEAETVMRGFTANQLREHPIVALTGRVGIPYGHRSVAYVSANDNGVSLGLYLISRRWYRRCRFLAVGK